MSNEPTPSEYRIYVACLAAYNNGKLHGRWIDADDSAEMQEQIDEMLEESPEPDAEEWAVHDYDGFGGLSLGEHPDLCELESLVALLDEHGEAYLAYVDHVGIEYATESDFQDRYSGEWDSEQAFAENLVDECYDLDKTMGNLAYYFDYEAFTKDLFIDGYDSVDSSTGGVFVFINC